MWFTKGIPISPFLQMVRIVKASLTNGDHLLMVRLVSTFSRLVYVSEYIGHEWSQRKENKVVFKLVRIADTRESGVNRILIKLTVLHFSSTKSQMRIIFQNLPTKHTQALFHRQFAG